MVEKKSGQNLTTLNDFSLHTAKIETDLFGGYDSNIYSIWILPIWRSHGEEVLVFWEGLSSQGLSYATQG